MRAEEGGGGGGRVSALTMEQAEVVQDHGDAANIFWRGSSKPIFECCKSPVEVAFLHQLQPNVVVRYWRCGMQFCCQSEVANGLVGEGIARIQIAKPESSEPM